MKKPSAQSGGLFIVRINTARNNPRALYPGLLHKSGAPYTAYPIQRPITKIPGLYTREFS